MTQQAEHPGAQDEHPSPQDQQEEACGPEPSEDTSGASGEGAGTGQLLADVLPGYLDLLEDPALAEHPTVPTGFRDLDELLAGGLHPGTLTVIASRPATGKSTLLSACARSAALAHDIPTLWVDQESSQRRLVDRILAAEAPVPVAAIRNQSMNDWDWTRVARTMGRIAVSPLWLQTEGRTDVRAVCARARRYQMVAIDGLHQMRPCRMRDTREQEVSDIVRDLKDLALKQDIPVVVTAHLNRAPLHRTVRTSTLDDLRESDAIAYLADTVLVLERSEHRGGPHALPGEVDIVAVKHRGGPTITVSVAAQDHYARFVDLAQE